METVTIDATNQTLGRIASKVAHHLRGKHLPSYDPRLLPHVNVIIKNITGIRFTGSKMAQKQYYHFSGYPGGIRARSLAELWKTRPELVFRKAVYRMLPVNKQRDKIIKHLSFE